MNLGRLRAWLDDPGNARFRPWIVPGIAALLVLLLLSPGLIGKRPGLDGPADALEAPTITPHLSSPRIAPDQLAMQAPGPLAARSPEPSRDAALALGAAPDATRFDCVIEPADTIELGSPVTGVLSRVLVERGAVVERGQPVAELESTVERAAVDLARARANMEGALKAREASKELGERRRSRVNALFDQHTLSEDLLDQTETEARIAELELVEIQEQRKLASLELAQARALLNRRTIRSPIDGVVVSREMAPGEVVVDEKTIATLARIDPLRVEVILPAALYGTIAPGQRAAIEPEFGHAVHVAEVATVDRVIDAASGTFGIELELPNPDHKIPGGLHCQARFLEAE